MPSQTSLGLQWALTHHLCTALFDFQGRNPGRNGDDMKAFRTFVCGIYDKFVKDVGSVAPGHHICPCGVAFVCITVTNYPVFHEYTSVIALISKSILSFSCVIAIVSFCISHASMHFGTCMININPSVAKVELIYLH